MLPRKVCFVCGGDGASNTIHMHARDDGPYFPFLSNHEPPKGARPMTRSGTVEACSVCFLFLNQQWDSYEQCKTPLAKRVYWLKRLDNGAFTGAEMKLQGEYAAQLMGLQYHPSGAGALSPYDFNFFSSQGISCNSNPDSPAKSQGNLQTVQAPPLDNNGALDLSIASVPPAPIATKSRSPRKAPNTDSSCRTHPRDPSPRLVENAAMVCYICRKEHPSSLGRFIYASKYTDDEPFFPFLYKLPYPDGAMPLTKHGLTKVCSHCRKTLSRQWRFFESNQVCEEQRIYQINDKPILVGKVTDLPNVKQERREEEELMNEGSRSTEACYLCGEVCSRSAMKVMYTKQPEVGRKHTMFFPFVCSLNRPAHAQPIDHEGKIMACRACYSYLQRQWQVMQTDNVPMALRKFLLRPIHEGKKEPETREISTARKCEKKMLDSCKSPQQPLNIQISSAGSCVGSSASPTGLLAIASSVPVSMSSSVLSQNAAFFQQNFTSTLPLSVQSTSSANISARSQACVVKEDPSRTSYCCYVCGWSNTSTVSYSLHVTESSQSADKREPFFPFLASHKASAGSTSIRPDGTVQCCYFCYHSFISQWTEFENSCEPTQQNHWLRQYRTNYFICFVCGRHTTRNKVCSVHLENSPLLRSRPKMAGSVYIQDEDAVLVCASCEESLRHRGSHSSGHAQQTELITAQDDGHSDDRISPLANGVRQTPPPTVKPPALQSDSACHHVTSQSDDERSAPAGTSRPLVPGSVTDISHARGLLPHLHPVQQGPSPFHGLPPASKAPPLTILNNTVTRTTATVTPLRPASPSESAQSVSSNAAMTATRASSFAAALRKLAKQAGDTDAVGLSTGHDVDSVSSAPSSLSVSNPRDQQAKRPHHISPYTTSHPASTITSPPVVTIAPSLHSYGSTDGRKERPTSAFCGDALAVKLEHAGETRRDNDTPHSKDSIASSTARITPHSVTMSSGAPTVSSSLTDDVGPARGFQPYRSADDLLLSATRSQHAFPGAAPFPAVDPALYSAYHSAFAAAAASPHTFSHPAFRMDDPMLLERYRMMQQQPLFPYPPTTGILPTPLHPLMPHFSRFPASASDMLAASSQSLPFMAGGKLPDHLSPGAAPPATDRNKSEEDVRREREREAELERERERARQREERDRLERREREKHRQKTGGELRDRKSPAFPNSLKLEDSGGRGYTREAYSSGALNYSTSSKPATDQEASRSVEMKERERQLLHQQFVREQDQLRGGRLPGHTETHTKHPLSPHHNSVKHSNFHSSSHQAKSDMKTNTSHFHRPFEKSLANGHEKTEQQKESGVRLSSSVPGYSVAGSDLPRTCVSTSVSAASRHSHTTVSLPEFTKQGVGMEVSQEAGPHSEFTYQLPASSQPAAHYRHQDNTSRKSPKSDHRPPGIDRAVSDRAVSDSTDGGEKKHHMNVSSPGAHQSAINHLDHFVMKSVQEKRPGSGSERHNKRRRLYHSPRPASRQTECQAERASPLLITASQTGTDTHSSPDYKHKTRFLSALGLEPIPPERRLELDYIRRVCEWDRRKRNEDQAVSAMPSFSEHSLHHHLSSKSPYQSGSSPGRHRSHADSDSGVPLSQPLPASPHPRGLIPGRHQRSSRDHRTPSPHDSSVDAGRPSLFTTDRHRVALSKEFAQEFHKSVLQTTRKQQEIRTGSVQQDVCDEEKGGGDSHTGHLSQAELRQSSMELFKWPGIDVLVESYHSYAADQLLERQVLREECHRLKLENHRLNHSAELLSSRMADLIETRKKHKDERQSTQKGLDLLNSTLLALAPR